MGQIPAKMFPMPTPYGQSPDVNVLQQAQAPTPAPPMNLQPLQPAATPDPQSSQARQAQQPMPQFAGSQGFSPRFVGGRGRFYQDQNSY